MAGLALLPNFAAAMAISRLTKRFGNLTGLVVSALGVARLSRLGPDTSYWTGIALPMALIGIGQVVTWSAARCWPTASPHR